VKSGKAELDDTWQQELTCTIVCHLN